MDVKTSHLAAALMSTSSTFTNNVSTPDPVASGSNSNQEEKKIEKQNETNKDVCEEDKEEIGSGDEFSDEVQPDY